MIPEGRDLASLSDIDLRGRVSAIALQITACEARLETTADESKRTRRIARATFLTAAGFFGLTLDPISAVVAVVGFFDWVEGIRDDATQTNLRVALRGQLTRLKAELDLIERELRRRAAEHEP